MPNIGRMSIILASAAVGLGGIVLGGEADAQQCETGSVEVSAISEAEYQQAASEAGASACVTPRASGLTVCQIVPQPGASEWVVVAQAPDGGGDAQSAVELEVASGRTCLFNASTPVESTDSRWI